MKKRVLAALFAASMVFTATAPAFAADETTGSSTTTGQTSPVTTFADVDANAWYAPAVSYVIDKDLMDPAIMLTQAFFHPLTMMTREEVADAIYRDAKMRSASMVADFAGNGVEEMTDYASVTEARKAATRFCFESGVMTGDNNNKLNPANNITRQEFAAVLNRYVQLLVDQKLMTNVVPGDGMAEKEFTDYNMIADWAKANISFCLKNKLMNGNANGTFSPKGNITRAQMAQVLYNFSLNK